MTNESEKKLMHPNKPTPSAVTERADSELGKRSQKVYRQCHEEALLARSLKMSVLPPNENGSKSPLNEFVSNVCMVPECVALKENGKKGWKHRQHKRAGETFIDRWYLDEYREGIGYVCGKISGGLLLFEFEGPAVDEGVFDEFLDLAEATGQGELIVEIREGYEDSTPSGGRHWLFYCDDPKSEVLAYTKAKNQANNRSLWKPLIETRGEGGYAISAPTSGKVHPSGRPYKRLQGGLETIVRLDEEQVDELFSLARRFNQKPRQEIKPPPRSNRNRNSLIDAFNENENWNEILVPQGWEPICTTPDGREHWCRPGKQHQGTSATISPDGQLLYVFTTSSALEGNRAYNKFSAYAALNHEDAAGRVDWTAAVKSLETAGLRISAYNSGQGTPVVTAMSDVPVEIVNWLWQNRIPTRNMTNIAGDPGLGKSMLMMDLAARVTTGRSMPFALSVGQEPMSVLILTGEDDLANTLKPRLIAAGADTSHVYVLEGISHEPDGRVTQMISIPDDIPLIRDLIIEYGVVLVIIDPINSFLADRVNSNQDHSIRRALSPLKILAEDTGVAIVTISHLTKDSQKAAQYRINGSIGTVGAARSVLLVALDPEDEESRIIAGIKANLSPMANSLKFHIEQGEDGGAAHIKWDGFSNLTKDDLLNVKPAKALQVAIEFLQTFLADGPMRKTDIESTAEAMGMSERTLQRASKALDMVKEHIDPPRGYWQWSLPLLTDESE
jgi:hypothetical protein